jgi:hypothetical protein
MGPVVSQLEREYAGRAEVRRYVIDKLVPGTPEHTTAFALANGVKFDRTPTFLVADGEGRLRAMVSGATSYLTLRQALEGAFRPPARPGP